VLKGDIKLQLTNGQVLKRHLNTPVIGLHVCM